MTDVLRLRKSFTHNVSIDRQFPHAALQNREEEAILKGISLLESYFTNAVFLLCKVSHGTLQYVSANSGDILGHDAAYLKMISPEEYLQHVHPDDRAGVVRCYERMEEIKKQPRYSPENYKFSFHYRLQHADGSYRYVVDEKNAYRNEVGLYLHFSLIRNVEHEQVFTQTCMDIFTKSDSRFRKLDEYVPHQEDTPVTKREKEIIQYMASGLRTREIGERLHISFYTVRNHRANLFRKTQTRTALGLIQFAKRSKWIL